MKSPLETRSSLILLGQPLFAQFKEILSKLYRSAVRSQFPNHECTMDIFPDIRIVGEEEGSTFLFLQGRALLVLGLNLFEDMFKYFCSEGVWRRLRCEKHREVAGVGLLFSVNNFPLRHLHETILCPFFWKEHCFFRDFVLPNRSFLVKANPAVR